MFYVLYLWEIGNTDPEFHTSCELSSTAVLKVIDGCLIYGPSVKHEGDELRWKNKVP